MSLVPNFLLFIIPFVGIYIFHKYLTQTYKYEKKTEQRRFRQTNDLNFRNLLKKTGKQ